MLKLSKINPMRGDTIIEVLISITIAGLAIGTSFSIANKAIQKAISARERDQAIGLLESQVSALKVRQQKTDTATFASRFSFPQTHFCLIASAADPTAQNWLPQANYSGVSSSSPLASPAGGGAPTASTPYNSNCNVPGGYYLDISTAQDSTSSTPTNYNLIVRWNRLGGGINEASFYYRF